MPTLNCIICGTTYSSDIYRSTCGKTECNEALVRYMIEQFGEFKKVVRMSTGQVFKVPIRDIIEKGLREQDLDKYPLWEES